MDFTIVYVLGGMVVLVAAMYYVARSAQRRQQLVPAQSTDSPLQLAARVYLAGVIGRFVAAIVIGIAVLAFLFWPR